MRDNVKSNLNSLGFSKQVERVELGLCPFCGSSVNQEDFKDYISIKEFAISGLCQKCQDSVFHNNDENIDDHDYRQDDYESDFEDPNN